MRRRAGGIGGFGLTPAGRRGTGRTNGAPLCRDVAGRPRRATGVTGRRGAATDTGRRGAATTGGDGGDGARGSWGFPERPGIWTTAGGHRGRHAGRDPSRAAGPATDRMTDDRRDRQGGRLGRPRRPGAVRCGRPGAPAGPAHARCAAAGSVDPLSRRAWGGHSGRIAPAQSKGSRDDRARSPDIRCSSAPHRHGPTGVPRLRTAVFRLRNHSATW